MLGSLLASIPKLDTIEGYFMANSFLKGCRYYLHSAVKAYFKFVQFESTDKECSAKNEISKDNYKSVCEKYAKKSGNDKVGNGIIFKK